MVQDELLSMVKKKNQKKNIKLVKYSAKGRKTKSILAALLGRNHSAPK